MANAEETDHDVAVVGVVDSTHEGNYASKVT